MSNAVSQANLFGNPRNPGVTLPSRDNSVSQQMGAVLSALTTLGALRSMLKDAEVEPAQGGKSDGGTAMAVESSIISACNRLDTMIAESSRWDVTTLGRIEDRMIALYEQQAQMFKAQEKLAVNVSAPHSFMHPGLIRLGDGRWAAVKGDPEQTNSIIGLGDTPAAALENFDAVFRGEPANVPKEYLDQYEKHKLDGNRTGFPSPQEKRPDVPADSRNVGQRPGNRPKKVMARKRKKSRKGC
jgi:hypothetical protein